MADVTIDNVTKVLKDALYVGVGAGVIAFQKAQVQRREFLAQLEHPVRRGQDAVRFGRRPRSRTGSSSSKSAWRAAEERIEALLDQVEDTIPEQARDAFKQARKAAKDARTQVRKAAEDARGQVRQLVNRAA